MWTPTVIIITEQADGLTMKQLPSANKNNSPLVKIGDAARALGVSIKTLRRWEESGKISSLRTPGGTRLYSLESLDKPTAKVNYLSLREASEKLGVSERTVRRWAEAGKLTSFQTASGQTAFSEGTINNLLQTVTEDINTDSTQELLDKTKDAHHFEDNIELPQIPSCSAPIPVVVSSSKKPFISKSRILTGTLFSTLILSLVVIGTTISNFKTVTVPTSKQVLAALTGPTFLEVNSDTQINGALAINGSLNSLILEATPSANTFELISGDSVLSVTNSATLDQDVSTTGSPSFTAVTATGAVTSGSLINSGASTLTGAVSLGNVLNLGNLSSDPTTATNGATYYNTTSNKLRCYINGSWANCDTDTDTTGTSFSDLTLAGTSGTSQTIASGNTITIAAGNGVTTTAAATDTLTAALDVATTGTTTTTSANSGLEATSAGLSLLRGCANDEALKWNAGTSVWECGTAGGSVETQEGGTTVSATASIFNFTATDFALTDSPTGTSNISIDYTNSKITRSDQSETITGTWALTSPTINTSIVTGTTFTLAAAATTLNIGPTGSAAGNIVLAGGSGDTGCTINQATGALTCAGDITSSGGSVGPWTRSGTTLSPATAGDIVLITSAAAATSDNFTSTLTGVGSDAIQINLTQSDDDDTTDNSAGLRLALTSSSADADLLYGIDIGNITEGSATEVAFRIGSGWTNLIEFEGATNDTIETFIQITDPTTTDKTITFPNASGEVCLVAAGNCAGSGTGVTTTGGTTNRLSKFTGSQAIGDSTISDDGTTVTFTVDVDFTFAAGENLSLTNTTASTDQISLSVSGVTTDGADALAIAFTQADDADATDTNAAINIAVTSSSGDADTLYGINIAAITAGTATEHGLSVGAGFDTGINFPLWVGGTLINGSAASATTQTAAILGVNYDFSTNYTVPDSSSGNQTGNKVTLKDGGASATSIGYQTAGTLDTGVDVGGTVTTGIAVTGTTTTGIDLSSGSSTTDLTLDDGLTMSQTSDNDLDIVENSLTLIYDFGETTASTITYSSASALDFTISGDEGFTFTSSETAGTTTTSAFVYDATGITSGTGMYITADAINTGKLVQIAPTGNTLTTGTLLDVRTTATSLTGAAGTGSLMNLDWSPGSATTATGDLFALNIGTNGTTTGSLFNILDAGSSIFSVSETSFTTSLPTSFTAAGDVSIAYDINFTNQTASFIKSVGPLTIETGESFESNDLTLKTYNQGSVVVDSSVTTGTGIDFTNTTLTTGTGLNLTSTGTLTTTGNLLTITANSATSATGVATINATGLVGGYALDLNINGTTTLTTGGALNIDGPTSTATINATTGLVNISTTGAITNTTAGAGSGTLFQITANGAITPTIASISDTSIMTTTGKLLDLTADAATTTTGLLTMNSTGLTTGYSQAITLGSALTTGGALNITAASYNHTAEETGSVLSLAVTDATTNVVTSTTNGILVSPIINADSGAATRTINGVSISPTFTACSAGTCAVNGLNIANVTDGTGFTGTGINIGTGWDTQLGFSTSIGSEAIDLTTVSGIRTVAAIDINENNTTGTVPTIQWDSAETRGGFLDANLTGALGTENLIDITTAGIFTSNLIDVNIGAQAATGDIINIALGATAVGAQALVIANTASIRTASMIQVDDNNSSGAVATFDLNIASTRGGLFDIDTSGAFITENLIDITTGAQIWTSS